MMDKTGDNELMLKAKGGDRQAFENLYKRYSAPVLNFFYRLEWNSSLAEEGVQEVFYRLWKHKAKYVPRGKFSTYLFQIAKNYWLNEMKRKRPQSGDEILAGQKSPAAGPDRQVERKEMRDIVRTAISGLPENDRLPFVLARYHGMKHKDIAQMLGISARAVEARILRAMKKLETSLAQHDLVPGGNS
ncbi:MAG: RNA polymerase sigma factor [Planctomycetota bacterium]|nr:MAG: RNA polymerase sigma factor [Planctomycetota bacterium]